MPFDEEMSLITSSTRELALPVKRRLPSLPVEIWLKIFRLYLGPSLSNPRQNSLYAYEQFVFLFEGHAECRYKEKEKMRAPLRLVCRAWKAISDILDDAILVSRLDEFDWPPGRIKSQAKTIYYGQRGSMSYGGRRIARGDRGLQLGGDLVVAPITSVVGFGIDILPTHNLTPALLALQWQPSSGLETLSRLHHPVFSGLRALSLCFAYPSPLQENSRDFTLPELHYLDLVLFRNDSQTVSPTKGVLSTWRFPKLSLLRVQVIEVDAEEELLDLVRAHAVRIKELYTTGFGHKFPTRHDWRRLSSLRLIVFDSFNEMAAALSTVDVLWTSGLTGTARDSNKSEVANRRLTMGLQYLQIDVNTEPPNLQAFETSGNILTNLDFAMTSTWETIEEYLIFTEPSKAVVDTLEMMDKLGVDFVDPDGYGFDSDGFHRLKDVIQKEIH